MSAVDDWQRKHDSTGKFNIGWEMQEMLAELSLRPVWPAVVLEIGTFQGDSLRVWREVFDPALLIGVQDTDETTPEVALEVQARMVIGKSQDPETQDKVLAILNGRPVDLLYVDGDHHYAEVRRDWELYSPLVRPGGTVVLHDAVIEDNDTVEVFRFYREIREGRQTKLLYGGHGSTGAALVFV